MADSGAELADAVARLRRALRRAARAAQAADQLAVAQLELLACLNDHPGARPGEVARILQLAPNSVTTLAGGLERLGMLTREHGRADRRTIELNITQEGRTALTRWQAANAGVLTQAFLALDDQDAETIRAALPALGRLTRRIDELP